MSKIPLHLTIRALDEFEQICQLQQLLHICLEQLDSVSLPVDSDNAKFVCRVELLILIYLNRSEQHFKELKINLETSRKLK